MLDTNSLVQHSSLSAASKSDNCLEKKSISDRESDKTCRICLSKSSLLSSNGPLIHPCWCKGSIGLVHKSCLEKWLTISQSDSCDLCSFKFDLAQRPKSIFCWWNESEVKLKCYLITDFVCFLILTPVTIASLNLCLQGIYYYATTTLEVTGLAVLIFLLMLTYILWFATCVYQHGQQLRSWRRENLCVSLVSQDCNNQCNNNNTEENMGQVCDGIILV